MAASSQNINVGTFLPRTSTERQESVEAGFAELVGVEPESVLKAVNAWWEHGAWVPDVKSSFGDGNAAERTVEILQDAGYF